MQDIYCSENLQLNVTDSQPYSFPSCSLRTSLPPTIHFQRFLEIPMGDSSATWANSSAPRTDTLIRTITTGEKEQKIPYGNFTVATGDGGPRLPLLPVPQWGGEITLSHFLSYIWWIWHSVAEPNSVQGLTDLKKRKQNCLQLWLSFFKKANNIFQRIRQCHMLPCFFCFVIVFSVSRPRNR